MLQYLQNNIPVFCPALTDGSLGDIMFFHSYKNPGLIVDIVEGESSEWPCEYFRPANFDPFAVNYNAETVYVHFMPLFGSLQFKRKRKAKI